MLIIIAVFHYIWDMDSTSLKTLYICRLCPFLTYSILLLSAIQLLVEESPNPVPNYSFLSQLYCGRTAHTYHWMLDCGIHCIDAHQSTGICKPTISVFILSLPSRHMKISQVRHPLSHFIPPICLFLSKAKGKHMLLVCMDTLQPRRSPQLVQRGSQAFAIQWIQEECFYVYFIMNQIWCLLKHLRIIRLNKAWHRLFQASGIVLTAKKTLVLLNYQAIIDSEQGVHKMIPNQMTWLKELVKQNTS